MANTYTQINIHAVFAVKGRENLITEKFSDELFRYLSGALKGEQQFPLAVNGYKDHVHVFFEMNPTTSLSYVMQQIKQSTSKWINQNRFVSSHFEWQAGYGAFSYARSQRDVVIQYIINQEEHHRKTSFKEEYLKILESFNIQFENKYVFEFYE